LHQEVIDWLEQTLRPQWRVLETGMGGSTVFFAKRVSHVTSFEHDERWLKRVMREIAARGLERKCTAKYAPRYRTAGILNYSLSRFDLCFIDGRGRVKSMIDALGLIRPGGWLVLDDSNRERYGIGKLAADAASSDKSVFDFGEDQTTAWQIK
jgi:precorrin-6B methylase 2